MKLVVSTVFVLLVLCGCTTNYLGSWPRKGPLQGMVYDKDRLAVSNVVVKVKAQDKGAGEVTTQTDINGRFSVGEVSFDRVTLLLEKPGYESLTMTFDFGSSSQVVYVQMINSQQLNRLVLEALEKKEWKRSWELILRSEALAPDNPEISYLKAFYHYLNDNAQEAQLILEALLEKRSVDFPVRILLADIYERKLGDLETAKLQLKEALKVKYDLKTEQRLRALESQ